MKKPNILLILTDQQNACALSCTGNEDLKTPAMDSLAETGTRFEKAYCTFPLCTPSRGSIFTGLMPSELGIMKNDITIADKFKELEMGHLFSANGYECVYGGKWHVPEMAIPDLCHGFSKISGFDDNALVDSCIEFLKRKHEKPFLMVASFDNPHNICEWAREQTLPWGEVEDTITEDCPSLPANYAIPPYEPQAIRVEMSKLEIAYSTPEYFNDNWSRHYRYAYYRLVEKVDAQIERILEALRGQDLEDNTLIIFSSDHGEGMGAHKWKQKTILYEEAVRVPFIISFKGVTKAGNEDKTHLISNGLDILPTMCDYAGIEIPQEYKGLSVRALSEGNRANEWRGNLIAQMNSFITQGRMVRTSQYKYVIYSWGRYREQLFDMERDSGEMVNIVANSRYKAVLDEHRRILYEWCKETGDKFVEHYTNPDVSMIPGMN